MAVVSRGFTVVAHVFNINFHDCFSRTFQFITPLYDVTKPNAFKLYLRFESPFINFIL